MQDFSDTRDALAKAAQISARTGEYTPHTALADYL